MNFELLFVEIYNNRLEIHKCELERKKVMGRI